ncbi:HNH endonuclease signature motif containing protein [Microlunatus parietis]|uniref:HNH nuclease domain-containing protein n=1 Tax=Microlunatus parietis TaxID=682979 RepID=A0A7Y9L911_9ACTN|nr:HNH endonuclease signature motif containing protein [Microlunatus parietis]NYE69077.1 hypothetical protein [Microlunatus parietis]
MTTTTLDTATPVGAAVQGARMAVAALVAAVRQGGLDHHDPAGLIELIELLAELELVRNQLLAVDADLIAACRDAGVPERECQRSMIKVLERRFLLGPQEAARRVRAAEAAGPRRSMTGLPLPRWRPAVGAAMAVGAITGEQTVIVTKTLDHLEAAKVAPTKVAEVETELVGHCSRFGPQELRRLSQRYLDALDPDGTEPDEQLHQDRRFFRLRSTPSGAMTGEFRLTPETAVKVRAVLEPLAHPRLDAAAGGGAVDLRSHEQRLHDAVDEVFTRMLRTEDLPGSGGTPAALMITIDADTLLAALRPGTRGTWQPRPTRTASSDEQGPEPPTYRRARSGQGTANDGTVLSVAEIMRLAGEAELYPIALTSHGIPLELGRTRRIATKHQTVALIARDGGCSFPGCDRAPAWCERHHVRPWAHGGETVLGNLTLLCLYHHRNFLDRGWQVRINTDGLPEWIPPQYLDRDQKPLINNRILARIRQRPLLT